MAFRTLADRSKGCEWPITWYTWHVRQIFLREWDSWILWVNNDAVQTTEHKSAVLLISFCRTSIFFSFLEGKDWWRRSHGRLTYYSFYVDSVYIFNYKCIWFLFFLFVSYLLYKWNAIKKNVLWEGTPSITNIDEWIQDCKHIFQRNFIDSIRFSISVIKRLLEC